MAKADAQTSLRMPAELQQRLAAAATGAGHGIGEEIRKRLEQSFSAPEADAETARLLMMIGYAAKLLRERWTPWHTDPRALTVFKAAVDTLLAWHKPTEHVAMSHEGLVLFEGTPELAGERLALMADLAELL